MEREWCCSHQKGKMDIEWLYSLEKLALAAVTSKPTYLWLNKKLYFSFLQSLLQRDVLVGQLSWQLSTTHWLRNPGFFHLRMLLSILQSLQVCSGRGRVSWTRHNCSQLPWPQNDTSICPCIHWGKLSHMAPHRCQWDRKCNSAACLGRDLMATWPVCDTKANPTHI